jgi:hypothetical protein
MTFREKAENYSTSPHYNQLLETSNVINLYWLDNKKKFFCLLMSLSATKLATHRYHVPYPIVMNKARLERALRHIFQPLH